MTDERRIAKRVSASSADISVINRINESNMGTIANLSETGFMIMTDQAIDIDSVFQLQLTCCEDFPSEILLGAVCLWTDSNSDKMFWAGFHIIDISDEAEKMLKMLIEKLSQN